jgi:hypothetical protein
MERHHRNILKRLFPLWLASNLSSSFSDAVVAAVRPIVSLGASAPLLGLAQTAPTWRLLQLCKDPEH